MPPVYGDRSTIPNGDGMSHSAEVEPNPLGDNLSTTEYDILPAGFSSMGGTFDGRYIWMASFNGSVVAIQKVDTSTGTTESISLPNDVSGNFVGSVFDGQHVWFIPHSSNKLVRINKDTNVITSFDGWPAGSRATESSGQFAGGAFDGTYLWLSPYGALKVVRVDVSDGSMTAYDLPGAISSSSSSKFIGAVYDGERVWLLPYSASEVVSINPADGSMTTHSSWPAGFAKATSSIIGGVFDGRYIWLTPYLADQIVRLDTMDGSMMGFNSWPAGFDKTSSMYFGGAFDGQAIWYIPLLGGKLIKIDKDNGEIQSFSLNVCGSPSYMGGIFDGNRIWLVPGSPVTKLASIGTSLGSGDDTAPVLTSGDLAASSITYSGAVLSWSKASDNVTVSCNLEYQVYQSASPNIGTVADIEINGTPIGSPAKDIATSSITGLTQGTSYYFNVLVKDGSGNKTAYTMTQVTTLEPTVTLSYNGNGHTEGSVPVDGTAYTQGQAVAVAGNTGALYKSGYVFEGWNTAADGSGQDYAPGASITLGSTNVTLYAKWRPLSEEARLSALELFGVLLSPAFDSDTLAYTATVGYAVENTTVTATASSDLHDTMTLNGDTVLVSGQTSAPVGLAVGQNELKVKVTAEDSATEMTYTVNITREALILPPTVPAPPKEDGFRIIVNGQPQEQIASVERHNSNGRSSLSVHVDTDKLAAQLAKEGSKPTITIPVTGAFDKVSTNLNGAAVKAMENKQALLDIQTPIANYRLPASELGVERLNELLGEGVQAEDMVVQIVIEMSDAEKVLLMNEAEAKGGFQVLTAPVDFKIYASYQEKTVEVKQFTAYVEREIMLPEGTDAGKVTTALVLNADGSTYHVPTYVTSRDGKSYAVINSLTNSTYTLVYSPKSFKDLEGHWAQSVVTDLASRLVINGVSAERYSPDTAITRADFAAIVIRALGLSEANGMSDFLDVEDEAHYAGAVARAQEFGLIEGYQDGTFRPDQTITRQEAMVILTRAFKLAGLSTEWTSSEDPESNLAMFADRDTIAAWAKPAAATMVRHQLAMGNGGFELMPEKELTRAETAALVQRLLKAAELINE
ncbi:S-layer homology domain-containing protein [Paenibacillus sp. PL2-23]|uniref:S-layer homology domain-containing protein n=1 Tax=Paenibacillus sp. PL2-23 TaxID=2100729 RepID=UPI0030F61DBF